MMTQDNMAAAYQAQGRFGQGGAYGQQNIGVQPAGTYIAGSTSTTHVANQIKCRRAFGIIVVVVGVVIVAVVAGTGNSYVIGPGVFLIFGGIVALCFFEWQHRRSKMVQSASVATAFTGQPIHMVNVAPSQQIVHPTTVVVQNSQGGAHIMQHNYPYSSRQYPPMPTILTGQPYPQAPPSYPVIVQAAHSTEVGQTATDTTPVAMASSPVHLPQPPFPVAANHPSPVLNANSDTFVMNASSEVQISDKGAHPPSYESAVNG